MQFTKAKPQQARLKLGVYGPPGSGKTFTSLLFAEGLAKHRGKRIAFVDTEHGTDFYAMPVPTRQVHPDAVDFDAIYTRSLADVLAAVKGLDQNVYGVVVIDSITHLWEAAIEAFAGKKTSADTIPMQAWGTIKKPYKALIAFLIASPLDVIFCGRQKNIFENDAEGEMKKVGVGMKAEGETPYEPHVCIRMEAKRIGDGTVYMADVEKDRTGVLAGRVLRNPNFETIKPLLPLLGDVQAPAEDEDDRIAKDGELHQQADDKLAAKGTKSAALLTEFTARITGAATLEDIGVIGIDWKKQARFLLPEHAEALRQLKTVRIEAITQAVTGG